MQLFGTVGAQALQGTQPDAQVLIDPLADGLSLKPFFDLMADSNVVKVFHAARQDIEIFVKLTGKVPLNIYDTQVAASVCARDGLAGAF